MKFRLNKNSVNSQTFYNVISTIFRTGITFFTMPIFTRLLGAEQYGKYSIYLSWYNILACILGFGCGSAIATGMYKFKSDYLRFKSSSIFAGTAGSIILISLLCLAYPILSHYIKYPFIIYIIMLLQGLGNYWIGFAGNVWAYEKKAQYNMMLSLATVLSTTILSMLFIMLWRFNKNNLYQARVFGEALPIITIGSIVFYIIFRNGKTFYNKQYWQYSFSFGIPVVFHLLSHQVLGSSDRIMMQQFSVSSASIGVYSFYYNFVGILSALLTALNNSWVPFLYDELSQKQYKKLNMMVKNYVQIFTIIVCGFILLAREVSKLFSDSSFWNGTPLIPLLSIVMYCTFCYQFAVNFEFFQEQPKIIAYGTAFAAIENIILNAILIPKYEMYGAAAATVISYISLVFIHCFVVEHWKFEKYPLEWKSLILGALCVFICSILFFMLDDLVIIRWLLGTALGICLVCSILKRKTIF